jgi:hypothetical protein
MVEKGLRPEERTYAMSGPLFSRLFARATEILDRRFRWHKLPLPLGLLTLMGLRMRLRERNLYDTSSATPAKVSPPEDGRHLTARTADGAFNDLESPAMGSAETRFGRNVPVELTYPDNDWALLKPSPRTVSRELMTRREFLPATTLNVLAGAWLQFMIRDWFSHGKSETENPWEVELAEDDPWTQERPMRIMRTRKDPTHPPEDSSPPYVPEHRDPLVGRLPALRQQRRDPEEGAFREDGKLVVGPDGMLSRDLVAQASKEPGFWVGLAMLQTLFVLEHNAICDRLRAEYPSWSDDDLFDRARLINSALLAKIHTVEWTTAILGHPALQIAMRANWWGVAGERIHKLLGRLGDSEVLSGIPGSPKDHYACPLRHNGGIRGRLPDAPPCPRRLRLQVRIGRRAAPERSFREVAGPRVPEVLDQVPMKDLLYSFGVAHPGAITLHNFPVSSRSTSAPTAC